MTPLHPRPKGRSVLSRLAATVATLALVTTTYAPPARASGSGDPIFVIGEGGVLIPIAVRTGTTFVNPGSNDGGPSQSLEKAAVTALASAGNKVNVIFGGRVVATATAAIPANQNQAVITIPPSLHLGGNVSALASTLGGYAKTPRRAPTATERQAALATAAAKLHTTPARLTVRNLTAIDLGRGIALVGTVNLRGTATPRIDKRLFFITERINGTPTTTLSTLQSITVSEALLEEPAEYLVDALDLGHDTPALVTSIIGYDANTYAIYTRKPNGTWKSIYTGGGAAL